MSKAFMIIDTETVSLCPGTRPNPHDSVFYDLGYLVIKDGIVLESKSFVNIDVFGNYKLMRSAYFSDKLPQYFKGIGTEWDEATTLEIFQDVRATIERYGIKNVWAYNAKFDQTVTVNTIKHFSNGFIETLIPANCKWRDIWDYAGSTLCATKKYVKYCLINGFVTTKGNPQTNADTVLKYITNDLNRDEQHTALSDCYDELAILLAAKRRKQKARQSLGQGWRDAARLMKEY